MSSNIYVYVNTVVVVYIRCCVVLLPHRHAYAFGHRGHCILYRQFLADRCRLLAKISGCVSVSLHTAHCSSATAESIDRWLGFNWVEAFVAIIMKYRQWLARRWGCQTAIFFHFFFGSDYGDWISITARHQIISLDKMFTIICQKWWHQCIYIV